MKQSLFSRMVVIGVAGAATFGWVGAQTAPVDSGHSAPLPVAAKQVIATSATSATANYSSGTSGSAETITPGVRNRASWQPSPIPSRYSQFPTAVQGEDAPASLPIGGVVPDLSDVSVALPVPYGLMPSLVTPGPAPSLLTRVTDWLKGLLGGPATTASEVALPALPAQVGLSEVLSHDRLQSMYGGELASQRGDWRHMTFFSRSLNQEVMYLAWLPPGYATSNRTYPTLYLLHGVGGDDGFGVEEWLGYALTESLERMLELGLIEPMIVVLPSGDQSYWMNHANGGPKWGDFVALDVVKHVDATFRTEPTRLRRAIGGLSMGGHGALQLALNHPDTFAIAGAHSPTIRPFETSPEFFGDPQWFARHDPIALAKSATTAAQRILTWIDVGVDDQWLDNTLALRAVLAAKHAPVEFYLMEGEHEGWYWQYYLPEYLSFYSKALYATGTTSQGAPQVAAPLIGPLVEFTSAFSSLSS
jgi:enterochelin esterase-like enzyme